MSSDCEAMRALCERAQKVCAESYAVRRELDVTRQETRRLIQQAHDMRADVALSACAAAPEAERADLYDPCAEPDEHALATLRTIRTLLTEYPIEWQVKLVKALAMRTAAVAWDRLQTQRVISA